MIYVEKKLKEIMMKKFLAIIIVLCFITICCSCNDIHDETIISDVELYDTIWELPERRVSETSALFPNTIKEQTVSVFQCKHTTYKVLGTGWQVELSVKYNDDLFNAEIKRLSELCASSPVCGDSVYFESFAYATVWNWNSCFEYAVINEKEKTIAYIYLQLIEEKALEISSAYIPYHYEMEMAESQVYSIYEET